MTHTGMRPRRRPPGFAGTAPPSSPARSVATKAAADISYRDAPARQLNVRLLEPMHQRYRTLLRELEAAGERTTMTELLHALLHAGPSDVEAMRDVLRAWREVAG